MGAIFLEGETMIFYIKNKYVSLRGSSYILNEKKENAYMVKGRFFSWRKRKYLKDLNDETIFMIRNKFFNIFFPTVYIFDHDGEKVATLKHDGLTGFKVIDYKDDIRVQKGIRWTREITKNGVKVGSIRRNIDLRDSFTLEINDNEDVEFYLALIIAIDNFVDKANNESN